MMDEEQLRQLIEVHKKRLYELELQQAQMGVQTPAHVLTEIDDIKRSIAQKEADMKTLHMATNGGPSREVLSQLDAVDRYKVFLTIVMGLQEEFTDFKREFAGFRLRITLMLIGGITATVILAFLAGLGLAK